ncbi:MAG TPA: methyltransferase domain-containing protein [Ktedonobacterales bacterium]|nr:methyltransferase domain-containing protein [Ktedonobacterales bacterium]
MGLERDLFIDIDRQPGRERPRPSDVPAPEDSIGPLWPHVPDAAEQKKTRPAAPSPAADAANLAILPTMPLDPDLVESLASLAPSSTASRPLSLAEALAAMQTSPLTHSVTRPVAPEEPAEPPTADESPTPAEPLPGEPPLADILRIRVPEAEPLALPPTPCPDTPDDTYLERSYDLAQPAVITLYERTVVPQWSAPFGNLLLNVFQGYARQPGWQVIDVGCGLGYPTLDLAQQSGPDVDVAGIDVWGAGIEHARARAEELRLNNVAFLVADVAACDLPDQSFDVATCNLGLTAFAQPDAALRGIARLLQPNGALILTTSLKGTMQALFETYRAVLNDLGLLDLSWDVERLMHMQPTPERVEALLDMAGFTIDHTFSDEFALEFPDGSTFLRSPMVGLSFLQSWRAIIKDMSLLRVVFNEIERRLNARAAVRGRLDVMTPMLCVAARRRALM